jgi:predicted ATPase/class 3 adenylate cyclase/DNA-binding CsgD family transcriptional regulator
MMKNPCLWQYWQWFLAPPHAALTLIRQRSRALEQSEDPLRSGKETMCDKQDNEASGMAASPSGNSARDTPWDLPTGTVTFLFTDIEGSTPLWEHDPQTMQRAFSRQETIVREAMAAHGGYIYKMIGDAFQVAFSTASAALAAALAAQRALHAEPWGLIDMIKVRMALHTGVTEERGDDYVGPDLNRIGRLLKAGHGGQVLLSQTTADLVRDHLPQDVSLRDLGEHCLKDLIHSEHIYQVIARGLPEEFPPLETVDARPYHLPSPATPFVGREAELSQMEALLRDPQCRLISLVGLGGSGKTRLAIQAAAHSADPCVPPAFPHGVYFAGLAAVSTLEGMISAIADALRMPVYVRPGSGFSFEAAHDQLLRYLADKKALLVLDNLEQLIGFASFVADFLVAAPGVKLIATSRERLSLPGEWVLEVAGLSFPTGSIDEDVPEYAAVRLFVEGATRAGPFVADTDDWPAIARICQLLGGMPLGVEMAAAWTKVLSCQEIAAELERNLLALIATWRTIPERHRTLRTVFDHSWRLLSDEERVVFCRLSILHNGFGREAAEAVAGASLSLLGALIDKSFLRRAPDGRFEIHPVLRSYAAEKLVADPAAYVEAHSRHARYYSAWLSLMNEKLKGSEQSAALGALRAETQNLHDAWRWLIEQRDLERLHSVLPAMILFHEMHDQPAGAPVVVRLLLDMLAALRHVPASGTDVTGKPTATAGPTAGSADSSLLALVLAALRHFSQTPGQEERSNAYQQESLEIAKTLPDSQEKAYTLLFDSMGAGIPTSTQSVNLGQQCVEIFRCLGDAWGTALAQLILADAASFWAVVDTEMAFRSYQSSLEGFTRLGNDWGRAMCLTGLANLERGAGHLEEAFRMSCESLDIYDRMGDTWRAVFTRHALGKIAEGLGRFVEARHYFEANLTHFSRMGDNRRRDDYRERLQRLDEQADIAAPKPSRALPPRKARDQQEETSLPVHSSARWTPRSPGSAEALIEPLSARELEVLHLLEEGLTNREIAQRLCVSPNTVRVHTYHIYGKLGVNNRTQAVTRARVLGLLSSS